MLHSVIGIADLTEAQLQRAVHAEVAWLIEPH